MRQNGFDNLKLEFSRIGFWVALFAGIWLLGAVGLGWIVKSILVLLGLLLITPIVAFFGFRWWLQRNLVEEQCPVCSYKIAGLNGTQMRCPSCGEPLQVNQGQFFRLTPPGTVDVEVVDVTAQQLDD